MYTINQRNAGDSSRKRDYFEVQVTAVVPCNKATPINMMDHRQTMLKIC
jgi:hypothetical protein